MIERIKSFLYAGIKHCDKERHNLEGQEANDWASRRVGYQAALETILKLEQTVCPLDVQLLYDHFVRRCELLENRAFKMNDNSYRQQAIAFINVAQFMSMEQELERKEREE